MAADVSSLVRLMNGGDAKESGKSTAQMTTMDLLAGCCTLDSSKELDLDLQVPCGWEKRLDLKSGKIYLERCNSPNSWSSTSESNKPSQQSTKHVSKFQDLNNVPHESKPLNLFDESSLDLKLFSLSSSLSPNSSSRYQSVCTLDKVKSALERAEKETIVRKRSVSMSKSSSFISNSSSSIMDSDVEQEERSLISASFAVGCPSCLMYVLISKGNPKCPRCNCDVPLPVAAKKPRIDLNISI
ncbi:hypothetical protein PHJA_001357200 [Phtheirospermum japonicum]|uniref:GIR1-like zinc ribbon domain-containing protein n=1 Tax=Phtheirospermum japonicum TaxID=374723 RepID=A0A830CD14_9LAMI|nr:hypothetical protein PHJA_001357200 [Phtheirospermum japonicum]